ncbi:MAG: HD domain-containing protein [Chitinispirillaceae bacterium]|nr:HD domain-containing protein [Chitinispirillaceae bacterium]
MNPEFNIRSFLLADEEKLNPFAKKSSESLGRRFPMKRDPFRLEFARDETRILHSPPFRRLKHKTQVFLSPHNDHICTRMEHVLHVSSIASVIGRCLNLNIDLINAIAKGHDLGHPPFGHAGERVLDDLLRKRGVDEGFKHEVHGLRVVDKLTNYGAGLNLTYEVRDGIITHCGERFERVVRPDRGRDLLQLEGIIDRCYYPSTLEGCLVRLVDRIAYLGRDLEDAVKAALIRKSDIPAEIVKNLGAENGKIIGCFVNDTIASSVGRDAIAMSEEVFTRMNMLKDFNYRHIYLHPEVERKSRKAAGIIAILFGELEKILEQSQRGEDNGYVSALVREAPLTETFFHFIKNTNYNAATPSWRMVTDYIAGMTDLFAERTFMQLFMPSSVI